MRGGEQKRRKIPEGLWAPGLGKAENVGSQASQEEGDELGDRSSLERKLC